MGVTGLWQVLEPAGRPVNIHSLRGKVLAIDVSIWLHQLVKGFRDKDGNPLPNAHLLGVFHRVCKLLNYGIKPVFVFDGGVPVLKRQTIASRKKRRLDAIDKSEVSRQKILSNFLKQQLQSQLRKALPQTIQIESQIAKLTKSPSKTKSSPTKNCAASSGLRTDADILDEELQTFRDKFSSRFITERENIIAGKKVVVSDSESSSDEGEYSKSYGMDYSENFSAIVSSDFDSLPLETQHEILFEMTESKKMNSWGKIDKMPKNLQDFSSYQMNRLVKRRFLQKKIQTVQQEMGQRHIHVQNLDELLKMDYNFEDDVTGSQEKGFVLVKKKSPEKNKPTVVDDSKTTELASTSFECIAKNEREVISIDNFVIEGNWSDESDGEIDIKQNKKSTSQRNLTRLEVEPESINIDSSEPQLSKPDLEENEQLALAIKLSLMEDNNGSKKNSPSKNKRNNNLSVPHSLSSVNIEKLVSVLDVSNPEFLASYSNIRESQVNVEEPIRNQETLLEFKTPQLKKISSCSKFLDAVGFSSKVNSDSSFVTFSTLEKPEESSSDSESDDFIAVEELNVENTKNVKNQTLLETALVDKQISHIPSSSTVAVIKLENIVKPPDDDIFADIFSSPNNFNVPTLNSDNDSKLKLSNKTEQNEYEDCKWDSDPEEEEVNDLEIQSTSQPQNDNLRILSESEHSQDDKTDSIACQSDNTTTELMNKNSAVKMITAEYMQAQEKLNSESDQLHSEKGIQERIATSISEQMSVETQELLSLFGIPYIVSPMEAESQCAFLDSACLTDGTITDDSDVWLFGGQRVYKNFYSTGERQIEFYQQADIFKILNLDREKLILVAMLIGGDYSEGIEGVGPVSALELLTEFPTNSIEAFDTLLKFREWWEEANKNQNGDALVTSKIKEKLKKLKLKPGFPSKAVFEAYSNPTIDCSTEPFRWGNADLDAIRSYTKSKFGWDQLKCDGMLLPVLKNLRCQNEQSKQLTLDTFITCSKTKQQFKRKKNSKRLQIAVNKLKQSSPVVNAELNLSSESSSEEETPYLSPKKKRSKIINQNNSLSPKPSSSTNVIFQQEDPIIPQKVQLETQRNINKQKAIQILKNKKAKM